MGLSGSTTEEKIWNFLKSKGLNSFAIAGLMGNLYAESGLNPKNLQNSYEKKMGYTDESLSDQQTKAKAYRRSVPDMGRPILTNSMQEVTRIWQRKYF